MKNIILLLATSVCTLFTNLYAQVGIGTSTPDAASILHVDAGLSTTKGLLITGTFNNAATVPNLGAGARLMFYPAKAAFRAGYVLGTQWDNALLGKYSVAMGYSSQASGNYSTAIGASTLANGDYSTALGNGTTALGSSSTSMGISCFASASGSTAMGNNSSASGIFSTAMGSNTTASGDASTAMGSITFASGPNSTAMGLSSTATGTSSIAMGNNTTASGITSTAVGNSSIASGVNSTAMGDRTIASGGSSTAMGYNASTNNHLYSFCIGGGTNTNNIFPMVSNTVNNQMMMYFDNYTFYSGTAGQGVSLIQNGNSWVTICDKNKKENFEQVNGEDVLGKLAKINFTSWNYKSLDPKRYRHYGIMAQDFYDAFGKDKYGIIGNDTTVNPIDMIGIDMAAIQALEKRTAKIESLQQRNTKLESNNLFLVAKIDGMAAEIKKLQLTVAAIAQLQKDSGNNIAKNK